VVPPAKAVQVFIDEEPPKMTSSVALSPLELELLQRDEEGKQLYRCGKRSNFRWITVAVLLLAVIGAIAIPLVMVGHNQSETGGEIMPTQAPTYPYTCYSSTLDIVEFQAREETIPEAFVICPNTLIKIGTFRDPSVNDYELVNGDYPLTAVRENVVIQCGLDGQQENNCVFDGGIVQVLTQQELPLPGGSISASNSIDNFTLKGLTFTGQPSNSGQSGGISVRLSHIGANIRFENCLWSNFSAESGLVAVGLSYFQELAGLSLEARRVDATFFNCTFENIFFDFPLILTIDHNITLEKCVFQNIQLSALVDRSCDGDVSVGTVVDYQDGCAMLFYCGPGANCAMDDICVFNFTYLGPSIVHTTDSSQFEYDNLFLDADDPDVCQFTVVALEESVISNCTDIFTLPTCPLIEP
jgi:hypothetical protein